MSKSDAIDRLLASAIEEFSALGYEGASLRNIASSADVTLSMIHRYYGNKAGLIAAAEQKVWTNINAERDERLAEALSRDPPLIEDLMRALIQPVVNLALCSPKGRHMIELLRLSILEHRHIGVQGPTVRDFTATSRRWLASIHKALPEIPGDTLVWAYSFLITHEPQPISAAGRALARFGFRPKQVGRSLRQDHIDD